MHTQRKQILDIKVNLVIKCFNDQGGMGKLKAELEAAKSAMLEDIRNAHSHCSCHRSEILASALCGCFYCVTAFPPDQVLDWVDDGKTALCPKCGIDSVLGSASGFRLSKEFLEEMNRYWFS